MDTSLSAKQNFLPKPFGIANHEQLAFVKLDRREQVRIIDLLGAFRTIAEFDGKRGEAFASVAACNAGRCGFSQKSLERLFYKYLKSGYDWTILAHNWRGAKPGQPKEFLDFLGRLVSECSGRTDVSGGVYDRLFHEFWAAGKSVPGYGTFKNFWDATQPNKQFPFQKGWLESGFKPLHIRLCHLPGAIGRAEVERGHDAKLCSQLLKRGTIQLQLPNAMPIEDVRAIVEAYKLKFPEAKRGELWRNFRGENKGQNYCHDIACERGINYLILCLQDGNIMASKQNRPLEWRDFERAHETYLALAEPKQV